MFLLQSPPFCVTIKHANNQQQGVLFYMNITSKYRSLSVQAKAALWFTICSFLQKGISFITVPIFTRLMSTEEYGTYTVYLSWLQILTIMTSLYLFNGVYDNAMAKYEKQRDEYTSAMQGLTLVITGAVFALYCFCLLYTSPSPRDCS